MKSFLTYALGALVVIAAMVVMWVYFLSNMRKSSAALQEQANEAQSKIIDAMKVEISELKSDRDAQKTLIDRQATEIQRLGEQVTQAAKVDLLRADVEKNHLEVMAALAAHGAAA